MTNPKVHNYICSASDWATIEKHGYNDFSIYWHNGDCSSRGTFAELIEEINSDTDINYKSIIKSFNCIMEEKEKRSIAEQFWNELDEEIEYDDNNCIKENFYWWNKGTDRFEIWADLEELFGIDIKKDFIKIKETKEMISTPMTSCGYYMNIWDDMGNYDCFIRFHEAESNDYITKAIEETEDVCHHIMQDKHMTAIEKQKLITDLLDTYTDLGVNVIIVTDKTRERK